MTSIFYSLFKDSTKDLKRVLAQKDCVLFIGSGISVWSGLPSWLGMINELAHFIEEVGENADLMKKEAQRGELLLAASYGFDKLTKPQKYAFIRAVCKCGIAAPHEIHCKIVTLGPRCFITTNYDNLIEQSLRIWQSDRIYSAPITNRNLIEMGQINQARAVDFIYKPHGDVGDIESIIFTREQYMQLFVQGQRHAAIDTLKTLMVSRPIVYLGFGLRDPDFSYLRDIIANTYEGAVRDHYAIMADVSEEEIAFWRKNYGIHLINYPIIEDADNIKDHSALMELLDFLLEKEPDPMKKLIFEPYSSDTILSMARYAANLMRTPKMEPEFNIRVHSEYKKRFKYNYFRIEEFENSPIEDFLDKGPQRAILIGLPGAGKTYSLQQATARLAKKLHAALLSESFNSSLLVVPIIIDLKLYNGDLFDMVNRALPISLPFNCILQHFKVKVFIDSFNEMPKEYRETGNYESDFENFLKKIESASVIICSRNSDGLDKLNLPIYNLDEIDETTLIKEFNKMGFEPVGLFKKEIMDLLKKPFYFHYITEGIVKLTNEAKPKDFYKALIEKLENSKNNTYNIDIKKVLSIAAFNSLEMGTEAFFLNDLLSVIKDRRITNVVLSEEEAIDIVNWLISTSILTSYCGGRIAFVHQSITEYLAAVELARQYLDNPSVLFQKLKLNRWDQAIFLTISLLPPSRGEQFLQDVIKADIFLALNAVKYFEEIEKKNEIVEKLLSEIPSYCTTYDILDHQIFTALEDNLPICEVHETSLRLLLNMGDRLGGSAAKRLVEIKGEHVKDELLSLIQEHYTDFNFCGNGIGPALSPYAKKSDITKILSMADYILKTIQDDEDNYDGFIMGATEFMSGINISDIWHEFFPDDCLNDIPRIKLRLIISILSERKSTTALDYAGKLLLMGYGEAAMAIYFIGAFSSPLISALSWDSYSEDHVKQLEKNMCEGHCDWAFDALQILCFERNDLREIVVQHSLNKSGIIKAAYLYCAHSDDLSQVFSALRAVVSMSEKERNEQSYEIFKDIDLDWYDNTELFLNLLKTRNKEIVSMLLGSVCPPKITNLDSFEVSNIEWWMEWIYDLLHSKSKWLGYQLGSFLAKYTGENTKNKIISEMNKPDNKYLEILLLYILPYMDITTDDVGEDTITIIFEKISKENEKKFICYSSILERIATDKFIIERIVPQLKSAEPPLVDNLKRILKTAGYRHGNRYFFDNEFIIES